jgi:predicted amidohydrolase
VSAAPSRPRVAVVQSQPVLGNVRANLASALAHIHALAGAADLVVFPELFATGYNLRKLDHRHLAELVPDGATSRQLAAAASHSGVAVCGGLLETDGRLVYDTVVVFDQYGNLAARYRKTHLHPTELSTFEPGNELSVVPIGPNLRLGIAICFEHAFPEIFTELALAGANLIAIPSAVPDGYAYLIELRTRARAQDNQVFVAAANLAGDDGETLWCGRSAIVDPRGELLAFAPSPVEVRLLAELDLGVVDQERRQEPLFGHRRPELYARLRTEPASATAPGAPASRPRSPAGWR